jgi:hypothetical protein
VATKRRKIPPRRVGLVMPEWAWHWLRTGEEPGAHDPGHDQFFGWQYCGEEVPGLGRLRTAEDHARVAELRKEVRRADQAQKAYAHSS